MAQLRIPGPTPLPDEVLKVMSRQMVNHRGVVFAEMLNQVTVKLKEIFQTKNDVLLLTGSGTGGLEAMIVNMWLKGCCCVVTYLTQRHSLSPAIFPAPAPMCRHPAVRRCGILRRRNRQ